jgi:serine/threonine protein kinase/TolB-like protein/Tfp pilus assembly protein PilF
MAIPSHTRLGRYEVHSQIGVGGMGEVYLARDTQLDRSVALKILPADVGSDDMRMRRFILEAKAASGLNHPNILTIYEIGQKGSTHFIATEYIEGDTLRHHLLSARPRLSEVLDIGTQIASALSAAHKAAIVHRDIKPENIMIRRDGLVKVLDFGLAKLTAHEPATVDTQAPTKTLFETKPGIVVGTAIYMSPEQARGVTVDTRTDIFSLGVVLYEMVAGCLPFEGSTSSEVLAMLLSEKEPQPLARYSREVPAELERIVSKALRKNRDERYQTIKDLLLDLQTLKQELEFEKKLERSVPSKSKSAGGMGRQAAAQGIRDLAATETISGKVRASAIKFNKPIVVIAVVALLLALAAGAYLHFGRTRGGAIDSVAVLPFVNASGDPNLEYLSDGIAESLMNSLSQLPNLKVMSRNSAFRYKGREQAAEKVGKELNVRAVLTGSLKQIGDQIVISVSLDDALDSHQIWGSQYDHKVSDLLAVQREIARDISGNLRLKLSDTDESRLSKRYTENPEAYQLYLKGRFFSNKRTGEAARKAVEYFQQAIEKDPNYALGYAGLADAYFLLTAFSDSPPQESIPKSKAAAKRALELDEDLAEAHASLASALFFYDRNFQESDREFQRAIELNPNYATAHHWYGVTYLAKMERFDEAVAEVKRAQELDPLSLIINADLGNTYIQARQYDKAIEQLRKTIEMDQSFYFAHWQLGVAYEMKGSLQEATLEYQKARQLNDNPWVLALLGHVSAAAGRRDEALKTLDQLKVISKDRYVSSYSFAIIYAGLGEKNQAFQWLERSCQDHEPRITRIKVDPLLDSLRSDPRFADLERCVGLPQ